MSLQSYFVHNVLGHYTFQFCGWKWKFRGTFCCHVQGIREQSRHSSRLHPSSPSDTCCFGTAIITLAQFSDKFYFVARCRDGSGKTDCQVTPTSLKTIRQQTWLVYPTHETLSLLVFSPAWLLTFLPAKWTALRAPAALFPTLYWPLVRFVIKNTLHVHCLFHVRYTSTVYSTANRQHVKKIDLNSMFFFWGGGRGGEYFVPSRRRDSSVGTVTREGAVSIAGRIQGFFSVPQAPRPTLEPFQTPNNRYLGLIPRG